MKRIIFTYGVISGTITIATMILGLALITGEDGFDIQMWLGYLIMLVALSLIFVGIKRYRDQQPAGEITFGAATLVGTGIAAVAGIVYVATWEVYLAMTDHAFIDDYIGSLIAAKQAAGVSGVELDAAIAEMDKLRERYANPLFRLPMTFMEIFPVGLLITLISAALLRNSRFMKASSRQG